jgi:hypothetical protein
MNLSILEHGPFAGLMEKMMSKTNDTSKFDHAKLENRPLADSELDAVSGGIMDAVSGGISEALSLPYEEVKFEYTERTLRAGRASAHGETRAYRGSAGSGGPSVRPAEIEEYFIFRRFRRYQQAEKTARHQVVWSWHPLLVSSRRRSCKPNRA